MIKHNKENNNSDNNDNEKIKKKKSPLEDKTLLLISSCVDVCKQCITFPGYYLLICSPIS